MNGYGKCGFESNKNRVEIYTENPLILNLFLIL